MILNGSKNQSKETDNVKSIAVEAKKVDNYNKTPVESQIETDDHAFSIPVKDRISSGLFNSCNSSTTSLLGRMTKPSESDIRKWMVDTQDTVDNLVTNWQQMIIDKSEQVSDLLEELSQFVSTLDRSAYSRYLDGDSGTSQQSVVQQKSSTSSSLPLPPLPPFLLTAKYPNNNGTFESSINIYLHIITLAIGQVRSRLDSSDNFLKVRRHHELCLEILGEFSLVAEDTLKFLRTHEKILLPVLSRVLAMRNDFYVFLRPVIANPTGTVIPFSTVSLDKIRMEDDIQWLHRLSSNLPYRRIQSQFPYLDVDVGSRDFSIKKPPGCPGNQDEDLDETSEKLELIKLLLKQIGLCIESSDKQCQNTQQQLSEICSRITRKFDGFSRNLEREARKSRLKPDSCCKSLKKSLCHLEIKFHQVERILEEIPEHMRRVIGVADQCSRQLVIGLKENTDQIINYSDDTQIPDEWASSIEEISGDFFKPKGLLVNCFPFLWTILAKILGTNGNDTKLKEFWEQVRSELEDFHKEVKVKEFDSNYSLDLTVPVLKEDSLFQYAHKPEVTKLDSLTQHQTDKQEIELEKVVKLSSSSFQSNHKNDHTRGESYTPEDWEQKQFIVKHYDSNAQQYLEFSNRNSSSEEKIKMT